MSRKGAAPPLYSASISCCEYFLFSPDSISLVPLNGGVTCCTASVNRSVSFRPSHVPPFLNLFLSDFFWIEYRFHLCLIILATIEICGPIYPLRHFIMFANQHPSIRPSIPLLVLVRTLTYSHTPFPHTCWHSQSNTHSPPFPNHQANVHIRM